MLTAETAPERHDLAEPPARRRPAHRRQAGLRAGDLAAGAVAALAAVAIYLARRPDQLFHPYVWVEEGSILHRVVTQGWLATAFHPVEGYLDFPSSILVATAGSVGFMHVPVVDFALALATFVGTMLILLLPDSDFGGPKVRALMVLALAAVPTAPEVFGIALYAFWWATLWPVMILGWRRSRWGLRAPLLAVAALSSPAGGALFAVYGVAFAIRRRRRDLVSGAILLAGFLVQVLLVGASSRSSQVSGNLRHPVAVGEQMLRTLGLYLVGWLHHGKVSLHLSMLVGALVALFLLAAALWAMLRAKAPEPLLLLAASAVLLLLSALPHPLKTSPYDAGPRYYFLPYIAVTWTLLSIGRTALQRRGGLALVQAALGGAVALCALVTLPHVFRPNDYSTFAVFSWTDEVHACAAGKLPKGIPIQFNGQPGSIWHLDLTAAQCRARGG